MSVQTACFTTDDFFCDADSDLGLLSSDSVIFRTHRCILRTASPFFHDMLSLPQPHSSSPDNSLISMSEDSSSVKLLLQFCYPRTSCQEPPLDTSTDVRRALNLARKFDIDVIREAAERALARLAETMPESAYALAWTYELPNAARAAARATLRIPSPFLGVPEAPELESLPALALVRLFKYHDAVGAALKELADSKQPVKWMPHAETFLAGPGGPLAAPAPCSHDLTAVTFAHGEDAPAAAWVKAWWWEFVCASVQDKGATCTPEALEGALWRALMKALRSAARCEFCGTANVEDVLDRSMKRLKEEIERRVTEAPLDMPF
ncbi:hypothetical protein PENSPDRAFT_612447 [Peniophora sp. CONT]|nr:hypothetical protein PENSPDRAFT_612447 [Peniophora sp. CONT]